MHISKEPFLWPPIFISRCHITMPIGLLRYYTAIELHTRLVICHITAQFSAAEKPEARWRPINYCERSCPIAARGATLKKMNHDQWWRRMCPWCALRAHNYRLRFRTARRSKIGNITLYRSIIPIDAHITLYDNRGNSSSDNFHSLT